MQLFDTHFHFYGEVSATAYVENIRLVLNAPKQLAAGSVDKLLLNAVGGDYLESCRAREFAHAVGDTVFSCGVHPHQAEEFLAHQEDFSCFKGDSLLKAVGELGLDYFYDYSNHEAQKKVFGHFLALALEWDLPAIVHIRDKEDVFDAYSDAYDLLAPFAASGGRFVIHCYAGNPFWAEKFLALGSYFGVTGMVTFRKAENIRENLKYIPLERLFIETDAPYLAPIPHRGKENHPGYLIHVAAGAAQQYQMTTGDFAAVTLENGKKFFGIL
jgi:TatD DNase family protein